MGYCLAFIVVFLKKGRDLREVLTIFVQDCRQSIGRTEQPALHGVTGTTVREVR